VEKLFETSIPPRTIEQKARRIENATNVASDITPINPSEIQDNQVAGHGGARIGAGREPRYAKAKTPAPPPEPYSDAVYLAEIAISPPEKRFFGLKFFWG
jgi:hypothetical protein